MDRIQNDKSRRTVMKMDKEEEVLKVGKWNIKLEEEKRGEEETGSRVKGNEEWKEGKGENKKGEGKDREGN